MKKIYILILILLVSSMSLSACNLPTSQPVSQDDVATMVVLTLTGQAPAAILSGTSQPGVSESTPTPTQQTIAESETPTLTVEPTQTSTITATAISPANDPKASLGESTWKTSFDNGASFGLQNPYEDANTHIAVANSSMIMSSYSKIGYRGWRLNSPTPKNFYLEATVKTQSCSGTDEYGVVFRAPDYSSGYGYYFGLTCDGQYDLIRWNSSGVKNVINLTSDPAILTGAGQTNIMGIMAVGGSIKLYVNQKMVIEIADTAFSEGHFGLFVAGTSGGLSISVDDMAYWDID